MMRIAATCYQQTMIAHIITLAIAGLLNFGREGYRNSGRVGSGLRRVGSGRVSGDVLPDGFPDPELWTHFRVTLGCEVDPDSRSSKSFRL